MTIIEHEATESRALSTADQALLDSTRGTFNQIIEQTKNFVIADDSGLERATDMVKSLKIGNKELEKRRKELVDPLNETLGQINNAFNGLKKIAANAIQVLGSQMTGYHDQVEARLRKEEEDRRKREAEELARQKAEMERQEAAAEEAAAPVPDYAEEKEAIQERQAELAGPILSAPKSTSLGSIGSSSTRKVWKFELVDITKVPERYLQLNETAVRAAIQSGTRNISGLKVFQKSTLVVR